MADILTVSIDDTIKITENNYTYYYNNKIYVVTIDYIYIFNPSLNIIEKRIARTLPTGYTNIAMGTGVGSKLYCYVKNSDDLYKFYYNITDDTYNTSTAHLSGFFSTTLMYYTSSSNDRDKNILYYCGKSSQLGYSYMWDYNTNTQSDVNKQNIYTCYNQIVYYEGKYYILGSGGVDPYTKSEVTSDLQIYDGSNVIIIKNILPVKLRACSSFVKNGEIYFFGGEYTNDNGYSKDCNWYYNHNIYVYNINNQSYRVLNDEISIPSFYNYACLYNNVYYTFTSNGIIKFSFITYNNTYIFANEDGSKVYSEITGLSPIVSALFGYNNVNNIVSYKFNTLSGEVFGSFEVDSLSDKILTGFSLSPKSRPIFYLNIEKDYRVDNSSTFYASFSQYKPPATTFDINLYQNSAEINRVDKSNFLELVGNINCVFRETTSITEITILIEYNKFVDFNYVYIPIFNRYYFVTDVRLSNYSLYELDLTVDVLMSYKNALLNLNAFVDRNENTTNSMLIDKKRVIEQGVNVEVVEIENDVFFKDNETFQSETDLMYVINGYKIDSADTMAT